MKIKKKKVMVKEDFDKRIIEKRMMAGEMSEKDIESYLRNLPDVSENAEEIVIE